VTTIMFWNLYEAAIEARNGDDRRWRLQADIIKRQRPDVLAITEGWNWHLDEGLLFDKALADFGFADGVLYESKTECDMAVMWRAGTSLIDSKGQPLAVAWWHGFLRVTLELPGRSEPFVVMVSHYNPFDPTLRRIESSFLRAAMSNTPAGVLVMDANTIAPGDPEPESSPSRNLPGETTCDRAPLQTLADVGLVDVAAAFEDRSPTFGHYHRATRQVEPTRLDQAWATPSVTLTDYHVIGPSQERDIDLASDHRPISFEIG
jgi:hypothetical protein